MKHICKKIFKLKISIHKLMLVGILVVCNTLSVNVVFANEQEEQKKLFDAVMLKNEMAEQEQLNDLPEKVTMSYLDEAGELAITHSLTAYYNYKTESIAHRKSVFEWQLLSSKIIFTIVILLVFIGIYFSWLQFRLDLKKGSSESPDTPSITTLEASSTGLKVSSPVLGVIILVLSLAFFYLYLVHVFPIKVVT